MLYQAENVCEETIEWYSVFSEQTGLGVNAWFALKALRPLPYRRCKLDLCHMAGLAFNCA